MKQKRVYEVVICHETLTGERHELLVISPRLEDACASALEKTRNKFTEKHGLYVSEVKFLGLAIEP